MWEREIKIENNQNIFDENSLVNHAESEEKIEEAHKQVEKEKTTNTKQTSFTEIRFASCIAFLNSFVHAFIAILIERIIFWLIQSIIITNNVPKKVLARVLIL